MSARVARNVWLFAAACAVGAALLNVAGGNWAAAIAYVALAVVEVILWGAIRQRDLLRDLNRILVRVTLAQTGDRS